MGVQREGGGRETRKREVRKHSSQDVKKMKRNKRKRTQVMNAAHRMNT